MPLPRLTRVDSSMHTAQWMPAASRIHASSTRLAAAAVDHHLHQSSAQSRSAHFMTGSQRF